MPPPVPLWLVIDDVPPLLVRPPVELVAPPRLARVPPVPTVVTADVPPLFVRPPVLLLAPPVEILVVPPVPVHTGVVTVPPAVPANLK